MACPPPQSRPFLLDLSLFLGLEGSNGVLRVPQVDGFNVTSQQPRSTGAPVSLPATPGSTGEKQGGPQRGVGVLLLPRQEGTGTGRKGATASDSGQGLPGGTCRGHEDKWRVTQEYKNLALRLGRGVCA